MKKQINNLSLAIALFALLAIGGCSKKDASPLNGNVKKVDRVSSSGEKYSTQLAFDAQNRLTLVQQFDSAGTLVGHTVVSYGTNSLHYESFDSAGVSQFMADATLNALGQVTGISGDPSTFTYDSEGHLLTRNNGTGNTETSTYSNGNKIKNVSSSGGSSDTVTYTYLTDKTELRNMGMSFLGKGNKNLVSTETQNPGSSTQTHTYEYDSKGRVSKETTTYSGNSNVQTFTYFD